MGGRDSIPLKREDPSYSVSGDEPSVHESEAALGSVPVREPLNTAKSIIPPNLERYFAALAGLILAMGLGVMIGWHIQSRALFQMSENLTPMQYNTALGFVLAGGGLLLIHAGPLILTAVFGALILLIGSLTLLQYALGVNIGLDELFMSHYVTVGTSHPGRMAPNAALTFCLAGTALIMAGVKRAGPMRPFIISILGSIVFALGAAAFYGYLGGLETAYGWGRHTRMALHTSVGFMILGVCLVRVAWLWAVAEEGSPPRWLTAPLAVGAITVFLLIEQAVTAAPEWRTEAKFITALMIATILWWAIRMAKVSQGEAEQARALNLLLQKQIAASQRGEERLRASSAEMADLYNNAPCGYHSLDKDGVIRRINDAELSWLGYSREETIDKIKYQDLLTAKSREIFNRKFPELIRDGAISGMEMELIRKNGAIFTGVVNSTAIYDGQGGFVMSRSTLFDVTERKLAEVKLQESEARFRTLVETADDAIMLMDMDFNRIYENEASWLSLGYTAGEWKLLGPWWERIHPDDLAPVRRQAEELMDTGSAVSKYRIMRKDGGYAVRLSKSKVIYSEGQPIAVLSILRDVTDYENAEEALRASERKYRQLSDQSSEGIFQVDQNGRYLDVNPAGLEMVGYSLEEMRRMKISDLIPAEDLKNNPSKFPQILSGKPVINERRLRRKDGSVFQAEITAKLMTDGKVLATKRDITERKSAEMALIAAMKEAEQASQAKSIFLSSISHEIRTPLTAIMGFSHLIASDSAHPLSDFQRQMLEKVTEAGERLLELVNNVLDLAKIESGHFEKTTESVDIDLLVQTSVITLSPLAKTYEVRLTAKAPGVKCFASGDRIHLGQILSNLVSNAIKYNRKGGESVISWEPAGDGVIQISVSDEGLGVPKENISGLFKPFNRLGIEGGNISGIGIGLAIVKRLAESMGGSVSMVSEVGKGSTFSVDIPGKWEPKKQE